MQPSESLSGLWMELAQGYMMDLDDSPAATYLESRGIVPQTTAPFLLGYVAQPGPGHEKYRGMLSIPYITPAGIVAWKFRRIDGEGTKYLAPAGQTSKLFNVGSLQCHSNTVTICEGELDAIVSTLAGYPAVGVPGVTHWKPHHPRCFDGYSKVLIVTDNDLKDDGSNPGQDLARKLLADLPQAINVQLPAGMDVNEYVSTHGAQAYGQLLGVNAT
jgi:DNA primase